jgi:homocysteine S-methyltransferase
VVFLDGGIGTEMLHRGTTWEGHKVDTAADVIRAIHADYIAAGADVITTNTFQLSRRAFRNHFVSVEHMRHIGPPDLEGRAGGLLREAVGRAREARAAAGRQVLIAGAVTTLEWCFRPDLAPTPAEARAEYREIVEELAGAGVDLVLFETMNAAAEAQVAVEAAREVGIPAWVAFVPRWDGCLLGGERMPDVSAALRDAPPDVLLFNCAPPPDVAAALRAMAPHWRGPLGAYAHVGRYDPPDWMFTDAYPPESYLACAREWRSLGAGVIGGCCGTTPDHIRALPSLEPLAPRPAT